jgi:hypothetical protein
MVSVITPLNSKMTVPVSPIVQFSKNDWHYLSVALYKQPTCLNLFIIWCMASKENAVASWLQPYRFSQILNHDTVSFVSCRTLIQLQLVYWSQRYVREKDVGWRRERMRISQSPSLSSTHQSNVCDCFALILMWSRLVLMFQLFWVVCSWLVTTTGVYNELAATIWGDAPFNCFPTVEHHRTADLCLATWRASVRRPVWSRWAYRPAASE